MGILTPIAVNNFLQLNWIVHVFMQHILAINFVVIARIKSAYTLIKRLRLVMLDHTKETIRENHSIGNDKESAARCITNSASPRYSLKRLLIPQFGGLFLFDMVFEQILF